MAKELHIVGFRVGREVFGVPISLVHEIVRVPEITSVPDSPGCVQGVINLRGKVIPVISLRSWFGLERSAHDKSTLIIVVEIQGNILGFIVDSVSEVLRISNDTVEPPPRMGKVERDYISGVGKLDSRLLLLLDVDRLLSESEEITCSQMAKA